MSSIKFDYPTYKVFESDYHPQRPIIIDADAIESPETVTLRYEEAAAARAMGGGDSPPGLLAAIESCAKPEPVAMHSFESSRPYPDPQYPYPGQSFATQPTETAGVNVAAVHLNNLSFASNGAANQYLPSVVPTVTSYQPTSGTSGTKISIKFTAPYDLMEMTNQVFLGFGSHRSPVHAMRDSADESGFGYVASGVAPELEDTGSAGSNVPMTILGENTERHSVLSMVVGTFTYHDPQTLGEEGPYESITRRPSVKSPEEEHHQHHRGTPPRHPQMKQEMKQEGDQLSEAAGAATNTYPYASTTHQAVASHYEVAGYSNSNTTNTNNTSNNSNNNGNNNTNTMISTYHRPSYAADYPRPPSLLKGSWGSPYGPSLVSPRSPPSIHHTITRSAVTAPPAPSPSTPRLERTTTMQASAGSGGGGGSLTPHVLYATKAMLKMNGDLKAMASDWTAEELQVGRRLVLFHKRQRGSTVSLSFNAVAPADRPPNGICVSCIYWKEKRECYVTSVDTIALLEQLIYAPNRFNVDEKNRIRRNIEGLKPTTVSKAKRDTEDFFKVIMGFGNPKPRNIEKDIKVFPWKALEKALTKIVSKYSAYPLASAGHHHPPPSYHHATTGPPPSLLTPTSSTSPGLYVPPPHTPTLADAGYGHHHDTQPTTMASPRSLSGAPASWGPYTRGLSPGIKGHSPQQTSGMRTPTLPPYSNGTSHHQQQHQQQHQQHHQHHPHHSYAMTTASHGNRWDTSGYGDVSATPAYASHHHQHAGHVYGTTAYGSHHRE